MQVERRGSRSGFPFLLNYGKQLRLLASRVDVGFGPDRRSTGGEGSPRGEEGLVIRMSVSDEFPWRIPWRISQLVVKLRKQSYISNTYQHIKHVSLASPELNPELLHMAHVYHAKQIQTATRRILSLCLQQRMPIRGANNI